MTAMAKMIIIQKKSTESEKAQKMKKHYASRAAETQNVADKDALEKKVDTYNLKKRKLNLESQLPDEEPGISATFPL